MARLWHVECVLCLLTRVLFASIGKSIAMARLHVGRKGIVVDKLYNICKSRKNFIFSNDDVKTVCAEVKFDNQYDATKLDSSLILPESLVADDVFVVHLGQGIHKFVHGIDIGYHKFESVLPDHKYQWYYRPGMLDNINTSESNILAVGYNQRIIHDFLYRDITASPKVYGSNRTRISFCYKIGDDKIISNKMQIEIDLTTEFQGRITIFEAKNGEPKDFNVFQLFNPYRYYMDKTGNTRDGSIECCYLLRHNKKLRLYLYSFKNHHDPGSIELRRNAEYLLVER